MRTLGMAVLGLFVGLAVGFVVFDEIVARVVVAQGPVSTPWALVIGFGQQALAVVGAVVAVVVDRRVRAHRRRSGS
ncbi:DUF5957 family protein [Actinocatenispora rupis]|uniref:Uncharacterized protein n=1 Tax=Actinocatenispora rupis TaxID=519421 RepID=A0A8J3IWE8_9ACTN|nr:DUF5957 family protein [Actinocatenispora rupis]GID09840.1 hypothetical protein Aru02nite_07290 [Actinocatenispora rupis]